jgi:hypothetical protein
MVNETDIQSDDFESNLSFKENLQSAPFSANSAIGSISTSRTTIISSVHRHTHATTIEEKRRTKKNYFYKYYTDPNDEEGHHGSTDRLRYHLTKHNII